MKKSEVVVIGGGIAGLTAARELEREGLGVHVLEAQERVGGRLYSVPFLDEQVDLGGQWIGPTQNLIARLAEELQIRTFAQYETGDKLIDLSGKVERYTGLLPKLPWQHLASLGFSLARLELTAKLVPLKDPLQARRAKHWDQLSVHDWLNANVISSQARSILEVFTQSVFAEQSERISFLYFLLYGHAGGSFQRLAQIPKGAQQTRFVGGAQQLADRLAAKLQQPVHYKQAVRRIEQSAKNVRVFSNARSWIAEHCILALPPAQLLQVELVPALPEARRELMEGTKMGCVIKCIVAYDTAFWRDAGLSGEAISDQGPVRATFDECGWESAHPMLVAFVFGDEARRLSGLSKGQRQAEVTKHLVRLYGEQASQPIDYVDKDWSTDPWTQGCYVGLPQPGVMTRTQSSLGDAHGRVHFAGTETATRWIGYIDGAIQSGKRAAQEVLHANRGG